MQLEKEVDSKMAAEKALYLCGKDLVKPAVVIPVLLGKYWSTMLKVRHYFPGSTVVLSALYWNQDRTCLLKRTLTVVWK